MLRMSIRRDEILTFWTEVFCPFTKYFLFRSREKKKSKKHRKEKKRRRRSSGGSAGDTGGEGGDTPGKKDRSATPPVSAKLPGIARYDSEGSDEEMEEKRREYKREGEKEKKDVEKERERDREKRGERRSKKKRSRTRSRSRNRRSRWVDFFILNLLNWLKGIEKKNFVLWKRKLKRGLSLWWRLMLKILSLSNVLPRVKVLKNRDPVSYVAINQYL